MPRILLLATLLLLSTVCTLRAGTIRGRVTDEEGVPLEGVGVGFPHSRRGAGTNESGDYQILNVPPGPDTLVVSGLGYERQYYLVQVPADSTLILDIEMVECIIWIEPDVWAPRDAETQPGNATLTGTIRGDGSALDNGVVGLTREELDSTGHGWYWPAPSGRAGQDGSYTVFNLSPGYYRACAHADGYTHTWRRLRVRPDEVLKVDF